ncbi:hypothetical protein COCMIDRAFT_1096 [Bipolaris oryzae ATCC 44560]|uniref:F-box domain-containing protein n=1 Tax=Bipolaris oryzae ATCC 44560 TaxID=930090 RepID=W6ZE40_COCMI|nr:uncharacterized protein COCMIDRAFT_1096 [Bipolaris oryzae ATCC 44560]EUC50132.1 hypothetical protein COCMIDRAFT_1096 [Bipolaris oryzae ATCC 44560]
MMDLQHQSHVSAFSRFSDMLKDTTTGRRKPNTSGHSIRNPSMTGLPSDPIAMFTRSRGDSDPSRDIRRSSVGNYADRMRQLFHPSSSHHTHPHKRGISDLPAEVLQHIFFYLEFWELVRCQRVSKSWRALVPGDSPLLAEMLYLKPSRSLQIYNLVPTTFELEVHVTPQSVESGSQLLGTRISKGVRNEISLSRRCIGLIRTSQEIVFHPLIMDFNHWITREGVAGNTHGSWRDMLVSMPPLTELTLRDGGQKRGAVKVLNVKGHDDGVKLGQLFDVVHDWMHRRI